MKGVHSLINEFHKLKVSDEPFVERLKSVSPTQHAVLSLYHTGAYTTYDKIAEELNIASGTVRSRLYRAREKIVRWRKEAKVNDASQGAASQEHQGAVVGSIDGGVPRVEQG